MFNDHTTTGADSPAGRVPTNTPGAPKNGRRNKVIPPTHFLECADRYSYDVRHFPFEHDILQKHHGEWLRSAPEMAFDIKRRADQLGGRHAEEIPEVVDDVLVAVSVLTRAARNLHYDARRNDMPVWRAWDENRAIIAGARMVFQSMAAVEKARMQTNPDLLPEEARKVWEALFERVLSAAQIAIMVDLRESDAPVIRKAIERIRKHHDRDIGVIRGLGYYRPDAPPPGVVLPSK